MNSENKYIYADKHCDKCNYKEEMIIELLKHMSLEKLAELYVDKNYEKRIQKVLKLSERPDSEWLEMDYKNISEKFIREFVGNVNWLLVSKIPLSEDFIREYHDKLNWENISRYQKLSEDFIREYHDKLNWENICSYQFLTKDFIGDFNDKIDWQQLSYNISITDDIIIEFQDKIGFDSFTFMREISEDLLRACGNKFDWNNICYGELSESFIREFQNKVDWEKISKYQELSESFVKEFSNRIDWSALMRNSETNLSQEFLNSLQYSTYIGEHEMCPICYDETKTNLVITKCNHIFCEDCLKAWLRDNQSCPYCRRFILVPPHFDIPPEN